LEIKMSINTENIIKDFPILKRKINGKRFVYLDNAASSQKPKQVIDAIVDYYENHNANVHRGVHTLSEEATDMYEDARKKVAKFIGAKPEEITFTKGTTEAINRINYEWGAENLKKGDVILTTLSEHHSNFVSWQILSQITGATLDFIDLVEDGSFSMEKFKEKMNEKVKLIAISHASNVLGTIFPIKDICKEAKKHGALVSVDGAQSAPHMPINMKNLGCDFYSFSGHKMLGPMGIGVLWVRKDLLEKLEPYEYGGGMIHTVDEQESSWAALPEKFEAGTPNVAGAIGLAAAIDYLEEIGRENVVSHEQEMNEYTLKKLSEVESLEILGPKDPTKRTGLVSFTLGDLHPHDIATILNGEGIAVRSGQHCTMPLHDSLEIPATTRVSYYIYNTKEDIDALVAGIKKAKEVLS